MHLKSFGCSFLAGTDLAETQRYKLYTNGKARAASKLTWPGLIAKEFGWKFSCYAHAGSGNLRILESLLNHISNNDNDFVIIGWTWIDRFDHTDADDKWQTILPVDKTSNADFYYRNLHSQYRDKLATLIHIRTAIDTLQQKKIPYLMTCIDELIFEDDWHSNVAIADLQDYIRPQIQKFNNQTFLDWSRSNHYPVSDTLHPLESAHSAAAAIMQCVVQSKLISIE